MKKILATNPGNTSALIARVFLSIVLFPHGAQKLLGWFGGNGFQGTMHSLTQQAGLAWIMALLVIAIEFFGPVFLVFGFLTRVAAFAIAVEFIGIVIKTQMHSGFFMNWNRQPNTGEGLEYFILFFGLVIVVLITGGGRASIDAAVNTAKPKNSF